MSLFDMKTHRKELRQRETHEKRLARKNTFDITDLTPMNAINLILHHSHTTIQYK